MLVAVLSGFVLALFAPWLYQLGRKQTGWLLALLPLSLTLYFASFIPQISHSEAVQQSYSWVPSLNVGLSFYLDGLSLIMALLISGIGTLIFVYAGGYLAGDSDLGRFFTFLAMFMASMLGVVLADNLITLFIFWELTSITSYLLIGFKHKDETSRFSATQALLVTGLGGLILMAGLILVALEGGSWELSTLLTQAGTLQESPLYSLILVCVLLGAFTKSAQMPFHFWLPGAMAAPTPVSAYLHSATMVKAGVYLLARFSPILGHTLAWQYALVGFGGVTMLVSAFIAWQQTDLKRILAYSTVSALGTLVMLLGLGDHIAVKAALVFLIVHSLYKGTLFMVAGAIDHETGTRDITQLGGLRKLMPYTAGAAALAALSMSGIPPLLGFVGKELIYEATLESHLWPMLVTGVAVITNALTIIAAGLVAVKPFFGSSIDTPKHAHKAPVSLWLGPIVMSSLGLLAGVLVAWLGTYFVDSAASAVTGEAIHTHFTLWHGLTPMLMLSLLTVVGGFGGYALRGPLRRLTQLLDGLMAWGPEKWYRVSLQGLNRLSIITVQVFQGGYLRFYLLFIMFTTILFTGYTFVSRIGLPPVTMGDTINLHEVLLVIMMIASVIVAITTPSRLTAVAALGMIGLGMTLIFANFGAPDLAITEFSIDTLNVILLVLVLYKLPRYISFTPTVDHVRDATIAITGGILMTCLVLTVQSLNTESRVADYFAKNSYTLAKGHNIVNVILVDFRGIDTMGEITVLAVAAMGVFAMLKFRQKTNQSLKKK